MKAEAVSQTLVCFNCGQIHGADKWLLNCTRCSGVLDVAYDDSLFSKVSKSSIAEHENSLWRYSAFLPIERSDAISLGEGFTPLLISQRYNKLLGLQNLGFKIEYMNPTSSFKDRGTTVMVSYLKSKRILNVFDDSSGNAGSSLAAYSAHAGIGCKIYVPTSTSPQKLQQCIAYGATIERCGSRFQASIEAEKAWQRGEGAYASHVRSPYFIEGTKTLAFEIYEQMYVPDHLVFPVGGGSLLLGAFKGFKEMSEAGWLDHLPKLHCVQSIACMPIVEAHHNGMTDIRAALEKDTIAAGIRIGNPIRGKQVLKALHETKGSSVAVSDTEILDQQKILGQSEGLFAEPTSCAALAGLKKLIDEHVIREDENVLIPLTGTGIKTLDQ